MVSLAALLELAASTAQAQAAQAPPPQPAGGARPPLFVHDLPNVSLDGWEVRVSQVDYPPGRVGAPHRHPGFLFAYVLEGAVVAQVIGEGVSDEVRPYHVGEMFYEPIGSTHQVSKNASDTQPARLLAINLAKKGARV
jgi:quercetin dioxygenase-like cupin family protein